VPTVSKIESQVFLTDLLIYVGGPTTASPVEVPRWILDHV